MAPQTDLARMRLLVIMQLSQQETKLCSVCVSVLPSFCSLECSKLIHRFEVTSVAILRSKFTRPLCCSVDSHKKVVSDRPSCSAIEQRARPIQFISHGVESRDCRVPIGHNGLRPNVSLFVCRYVIYVTLQVGVVANGFKKIRLFIIEYFRFKDGLCQSVRSGMH